MTQHGAQLLLLPLLLSLEVEEGRHEVGVEADHRIPVLVVVVVVDDHSSWSKDRQPSSHTEGRSSNADGRQAPRCPLGLSWP